MNVALKALKAWAWRFKETKNDSPVQRTPGSHDSTVLRTPGSNDSPVLRTILDFQRVKYCDSPVLRTPGSLDSPVHRTPGSYFKMLITQPRSKKNQNGPRISLMWPGVAVWEKNWPQKISWDCPFNGNRHVYAVLPENPGNVIKVIQI